MEHRITIDGHEKVLDIRAMDEGFIVYRKMFTAPLTADNMATADPEYLAEGPADRFEVFKQFFRKQIRAIGSCMILAWDGDGVVGKMHFTTREVHEAIGGPERWDSAACYCVDQVGFSERIKQISDEQLTGLLASASRTLRILCFNIGHGDERWHGQGIAKAMVEYLKSWARQRNWRRIEAPSCPDITPTTVVGDWMLRRGALERRGFRVVVEMPAPPKQVQTRLAVVEKLLARKGDTAESADWYVRNVQRFAADPAWRSQIDKDYLMACDL